MVAQFLGVKVWELKDVPYRYRNQAMIILRGRHKAKLEMIESIMEDSDAPAPKTRSGKKISAEKIPYVLYRLASMADW
jgi:hypothetical protein